MATAVAKSDGIAHEFFEQGHKEALARAEEDRLMNYITKAKSVKEAESSAWPQAKAQGAQTPRGKEVLIQWTDPAGAVIKEMKANTDHVFRLPLELVCSSWNIKNVRFSENGISIKTMFDGFSDLPLRCKHDDVVGILADPLSDEEIEAAKQAKIEKERKAVPQLSRRLSSAAILQAPARRHSATLAPVPAAPVRAAPVAAPLRPRTSVNIPAPAPTKGVIVTTKSPSYAYAENACVDRSSNKTFRLSDEERRAREKAEEDAMWKKIGARPSTFKKN